ncbi:MAG TPA: hypothetical protein VJZ27_10130 [Aggregatilineales bacterium]|nr:hypothetical protein [Aggregatilineales bacterium]
MNEHIQHHWIKIFGLLITVFMIVISANSFLNHQSDPQFDQRLFVTRVFTFDTYPPLYYGISSFLISGIYNRLLEPDPVSASTNIKIASMILYLAGSYLLFTRFENPAKPMLALLCLLLMLTTRFPFGWLSTEVLAGAFLIFALWSQLQNLPFIITAVFLAIFAYTKPDLLFPAGLIGSYLVYSSRENWRGRFINPGILAAPFLILLIPAVMQNGLDSNRSLLSLHQHHAVAVERHQIIDPVPDPWAETDQYVPIWGEWDSFSETVRHNPRVYYDFLFLSIGNTVYNTAASGVILILPVWAYCLYMIPDRRLKIITLLFFTGLIPITLFSFMHTRYLTRFYPVLILAIYMYAQDEEIKNPLWDRVITGYLTFILLLQIIWLPPVLKAGLWLQTTIL